MAKSKFFRAFVSGATISDGRVITDEMIDEVFATFNAETYTPRINVEHLSGYSPEPPFNGYGDVVAVKVQTDEFTIAGKTEKRRALYCQGDGNDQLVALVAKNQKPYPSVELTDSYAGSGKVGLIGLAFTDTPASIGTQALKFSRSAPGSVFAPGADAVVIEFEEAPAEPTGIADAIAAAGVACVRPHLPSSADAWGDAIAEALATHAPDRQRRLIAAAPAADAARWLETLADRLWTPPDQPARNAA